MTILILVLAITAICSGFTALCAFFAADLRATHESTRRTLEAIEERNTVALRRLHAHYHQLVELDFVHNRLPACWELIYIGRR